MLGNPATGTLAQLPTDERLKRYAQGNAGGVPADERSGSVLRRLSGRRAGRSARNGPVDIPRNIFIAETGKKEAVSVASTMNMGIIWDLFSNVDAAARQLNVDADFRKMLGEKKQKLFPLQIGKAGNLQEWYHDWTDDDPEHRHVSHLFVLHPGREVSPLTPLTMPMPPAKRWPYGVTGARAGAKRGKSISGRGCTTVTTPISCCANC